MMNGEDSKENNSWLKDVVKDLFKTKVKRLIESGMTKHDATLQVITYMMNYGMLEIRRKQNQEIKRLLGVIRGQPEEIPEYQYLNVLVAILYQESSEIQKNIDEKLEFYRANVQEEARGMTKEVAKDLENRCAELREFVEKSSEIANKISDLVSKELPRCLTQRRVGRVLDKTELEQVKLSETMLNL
jgi:hypothetical protein